MKPSVSEPQQLVNTYSAREEAQENSRLHTTADEADSGLTPARVPLGDKEIEFLEGQIPAQAVAATQAAFWSALTSGQSVVCAQGDGLYEIAPDGSRRLLKSLDPNVTLPEGTSFSLK